MGYHHRQVRRSSVQQSTPPWRRTVSVPVKVGRYKKLEIPPFQAFWMKKVHRTHIVDEQVHIREKKQRQNNSLTRTSQHLEKRHILEVRFQPMGHHAGPGYECCRVGAEAARPSSAYKPIDFMWRSMMSLDTSFSGCQLSFQHQGLW